MALALLVPSLVLLAPGQESQREPEMQSGTPDSVRRANTASVLFDRNLNTFNWIGRLSLDTTFVRTRFTASAQLLANIVRVPFSWFLGPDWDYLSASLALGANFSYLTNSRSLTEFTSQGLILGAMVAQLEFPIIRLKSLPVFNTWSTYAEYQLWFISSDVSAAAVSRLAFGVRVGLF